MAEVYKLLASTLILFLTEGCLIRSVSSQFRYVLITNPKDTFRAFLPSILYLVQNNLLWAAANHLDPAAYLLIYQTKILMAALFTVCLLKRTLSKSQWASLVLLVIGVGILQVT